MSNSDVNSIFINCSRTEDGVQCGNDTYSEAYCSEGPLTPSEGLFWVYLSVFLLLVIVAGMMSGLTMGLLSLDLLSLKVLKSSGNQKEKKYALTILPIVQRHHLLLVTLLLANAAAVEGMPIFLDRISNPIIAIVVSVTAVLLFGEIIPQALCTRYGLAIGYYLSPVIKFLMLVLVIIAWPIAKMLDVLLGKEHSTFFRRAELKELVDMHGKSSDGNEEPLSSDEVMIIKGALEMRSKVVREAMTPLESVFMLSVNEKLNKGTMQRLLDVGHSRVPVYETVRTNIVGVILVKKIIMLDPKDEVPVREVYMSVDNLPRINDDMPLYDLLNKFQEGKSHMSQVWGPKSRLPKTTKENGVDGITDLNAVWSNVQ
jgi:ankyrin repeat/SOCS box protein 13/metal transporter CNNM